MNNIVAVASQLSVDHYLFRFFGAGVTVINIYFTFLAIDIISGYIKALKKHNWSSAINHVGLMTKFYSVATIVAAAALDEISPLVGVNISFSLAFVWTVLLILYEMGSFLENAYEAGVKVGFLQKWLSIFEENVTGDKQVNKEEQDQSNR